MTTKQRYEKIQSVLAIAGQSACLFLCILSIAEDYKGGDLDLIWSIFVAKREGCLQDDFYVSDQEKLLLLLTGRTWKRSVVTKLPDRIPDNMYTVEKWYNPRTGYTHFKRRGYDTLASSVTVKEGKLKEYYCYEVS